MNRDAVTDIVDMIQSSSVPEDILRSRTETLQKKLGMLLTALNGRLALHDKTLEAVNEAHWQTKALVKDWEKGKHYGLHIPQQQLDQATQRLERLEAELRNRDIESWRDVMGTIRDIIATWEELQGALAREAILDDDI